MCTVALEIWPWVKSWTTIIWNIIKGVRSYGMAKMKTYRGIDRQGYSYTCISTIFLGGGVYYNKTCWQLETKVSTSLHRSAAFRLYCKGIITSNLWHSWNGSHLRIEVHFFCLRMEMKGHRSRVILWAAICTLQDLHVTLVLSFPNANKKSVL